MFIHVDMSFFPLNRAQELSPHIRKAISGVSLALAPMEVLFRQLVLIPLSL